MIPGRVLHRLAAHVCSENTLQRVVEPAIADLQKEYLGAGGFSGRVSVLIVGYAAIVKVIAICALSVSVAVNDERRTLVRTLAWSASMTVVVAMLFTLPPLFHFGGAVGGWYAVMTLVPQAIPLAIPIGAALGLAIGASGRMGINASKTLLLGASAASVVSFIVFAWAMPVANQTFREIAFRQTIAQGYDGPVNLQKGHNEMSFSELRREIANSLAAGQTRQQRELLFSFHLRFSLPVATLTLVSVLLAMRSSDLASRLLLAVVSCLAYWILLYAGDEASLRGYLAPPIGAWLPNLVLIATAFVIASSSSSRLRGQSGVAT